MPSDVESILLDDFSPNLYMIGGGWQLSEVSGCEVGRSQVCMFRDFVYLCFAGNGYALSVSIGYTRPFTVDTSRDPLFTYWRASSVLYATRRP